MYISEYRDMLELKEIQRSLPIANQPFDPFTHKPAAQYLTTVPINLLPLLPETSPSPSPTCAGSATSSSSPSPASSLPHSPALLPSPLPADGSSPLRGPGSGSTPQLPSEQHFAVRPGRLFPRGISSRSTSPSPANSRSNSRSSSPNRNTLAVPQAKPPMCVLPLADASTPTSSSPSSPLLSPTSVAIPKPPPSLPTHLSHLSHLLPNKSQSRNAPKRAFNFLPLLDTPPTSAAATPMNSTFTTPSPSISTSKAGSVASSALSSPLPSPSTVIKALEACALNCDDEDDVAYASEASSDVGSSVRSYDPPTPSLTNASLDSSPPMSRASSMSPEFALRHLGGHHEVPTPAEKEDQGYFPHPSAYVPPPSSNSAYSHFGEESIVPSALPPTTRAMRLSALPSPALIPPSPLNLSLLPNFPLASALGNFDEAQPRSPTLLASAQPIVRETPSITPEPKKKQKKPKQVIVINDEEIEIGGDSENEEEEVDSSGSEASNSTSSASVSGGLSVGGFVGVGVGNSRFSRSMGERMMWSSSYVMAFEDDDSLSRSPTSQDVGFVGVSSMLGMEVSTESSTLLSSVTVTSTSTLPTPSLPSPELTPTPTPPPKSRPALLTPTSSPPPSLRSLPGPSGLASALQDDQCEHLGVYNLG
ncbi:hypothetical protein ONZ45_g8333 [Pleurotus djamor]|nr:hypothetical protein ONZ45_g8333 [Pleurotus djamor]